MAAKGARDELTAAAKATIKAGIERVFHASEVTWTALEATRFGDLSGTVSNLMNGKDDPRLSTLLRLVQIFDLGSIEELLGPVPPPMPSRQVADRLSAGGERTD